MTANERIEKLLNHFGQTISDLPHEYDNKHRAYAIMASSSFGDNYGDYICHLADVIDRLEIALETAARWMPCDLCAHVHECGKDGEIWLCEDLRLADRFLE